MTIVMVCTSDKLHESISVIDNKFRHGDGLPRYIAPVLIDFFLESDVSKSLLTRPDGKIYSCTLDKLISAFRDYIKEELLEHPATKDIISEVQDLILKLLRSDWLIKANLVVQECLEDSDLDDLKTAFAF